MLPCGFDACFILRSAAEAAGPPCAAPCMLPLRRRTQLQEDGPVIAEAGICVPRITKGRAKWLLSENSFLFHKGTCGSIWGAEAR